MKEWPEEKTTPQYIISYVFISLTLLHFPVFKRTKRMCQSCSGISMKNNENSLLIRAPMKKLIFAGTLLINM